MTSNKAVLSLSMTSSRAVMALFDEKVEKPLASASWDNLNGVELAPLLGEKYNEILSCANSSDIKYEVTKVFGVEGPGSFTGLRISSAFLKGLATALQVPLVGISSWDLYAEDFAFSLRPTKALSLTLEECIEKGFKFLQIKEKSVEVCENPQCKKILGLKDLPLWPDLSELQRGTKASLHKQSFTLNYGYTPEFVSTAGTLG